MIHERSKHTPSLSLLLMMPGFPVVPLLLSAAVLTALGAIAHSGATVRGLYQEDNGLFYDGVGRNHPRTFDSPQTPARARTTTTTNRPRYNRTKYTFDSFVIAGGIDLARFGLDDEPNIDVDVDVNVNVDTSNGYHLRAPRHQSQAAASSHESFFFELFEDFDLSRRLKGNETWVELLEYRRDATHPSLSFYVDKVAFKRWLVSSYAELNIDSIDSYLLKYAFELRKEAELESELELVQTANTKTQQTQTTTTTSEEDPIAQELLKWLPTDLDYAAKPTHLSCSGGVWLVHKDIATNTTYVGNGKKKMKAFGKQHQKQQGPSSSKKTSKHQHGNKNSGDESSTTDVRKQIAKDLSSNLQKVQEKCGRTVLESYALRHVRPGVVIEERFTQPRRSRGEERAKTTTKATTIATQTQTLNDDDNDEAFLKGGMEFKVFTIWGRAWLTVWRPGTDGVKALFFRNGTNLVFDDPPLPKQTQKQNNNPKHKNNPITTTNEIPKLPDWIDWDKVISIGETLGNHKDMFRTDIFVGVATSRSGNGNRSGGNDDDKQHEPPVVRYVVSETEIHPTPLRGFEAVFEEAGRLWLAGYYYLVQQPQHHRQRTSSVLRVVPNREVPESFYYY